MFEPVNCYACLNDDFTHFLDAEDDLTGKDGHFTYVKCNDCNLVYQNPRVAPTQIAEFYDSEYIAHRKKKDWGLFTPLYEHAMNKHDREKLKIVSKYIKLDPTKKILDVGCAVGTFLLYLKDQFKCNISGVDFKKDLQFPRFEEVDFHNGYFYDQSLEKKSFDLITMWHFLEHCYDPKRSLMKAHSVLKDDGVCIIEVPRLDSLSFKIFKNKWPGVQAPQHTVLFDKTKFIEICEKSGFEVFDYLAYGAFPAYFYFFAGLNFKLFDKGLDLNKGSIVGSYFLGQLLSLPFFIFQKKLNLSMQTLILRKKK